jgi:hypothetical protein
MSALECPVSLHQRSWDGTSTDGVAKTEFFRGGTTQYSGPPRTMEKSSGGGGGGTFVLTWEALIPSLPASFRFITIERV